MKSAKRTMRRLKVEYLEPRAMLAMLSVTSGDDDGAGTLREALAIASANGEVNSITISGVATISLESSLVYTGATDLAISGGGVVIEPAEPVEEEFALAALDGEFDILQSTGGGNLGLANLTIRDGLNGIYVPVPLARGGVLSVSLSMVHLLDNAAFGLHIDDQDDMGVGSPASIDIVLADSSVTGNGFTASDQDGVRVDEGSAGVINARILRSHIDGNGADGLELDERGDGDNRLIVLNSSFDNNGPFDPEDLDDGIDMDEAGNGSISVTILNSTILGNFDEGLDLTEADDGNIGLNLLNVQANGNGDEGIKAEESGAGNVSLSLINVQSNDSADQEGISISESGLGNLTGLMLAVTANGNAKDGIDLSEADEGNVALTLLNVTATGNAEDGVKIAEAGAGNLAVAAIRLVATGNTDDGLQVDQETIGTDKGTLFLLGAILLPNDDDDLVTSGVIVTRF